MSKTDLLIIYPEARETKIAVYRTTDPIFLRSIKHPETDLAQFKNVADQKEYRKALIMNELERNGIDLDRVELVMSRGGMVKPVSQGVYQVNEAMVHDLTIGVMGTHATNLGGILAFDISNDLGVKAYMANPVVVDELSDVARITGHPMLKRKSIFHALNQKHVANKYAKSINKKYEDLNLIICHIGSSGISVGAHEKGKVVDVNQAYDGGGPFGVSRAGTLPVGQVIDLCFSDKHNKEEIHDMICSKGGLGT